jgi:hypothetical protein
MDCSKKLRLLIEVESERRISWGITGKFEISDFIYSDSSTLFDEAQMVADTKLAIKAMKGFNMLTIYLNEGQPYKDERQVHSVRYINDWGTIKKSNVNKSNGYSCYDAWEEATLKDLYEDIRVFVRNGNLLRSTLRSEESSTEVANS